MRENRSGCLILVCSLIVPGLGQIIQGRLSAGFSLFIVAFFLWSHLWIQFFTAFHDSLNAPGAVLIEPPFWDRALIIGRNLAICLTHLWSVADCAKAAKE